MTLDRGSGRAIGDRPIASAGARDPGATRATFASGEIVSTEIVLASTLSIALDSMGDAPPCDACGTITVRSGTCYKCLNCGNSMGCS